MGVADGRVLGMTHVFGSAPRNRGFNVVLLAEGFTAEEQPRFDAAAVAFVSALIGTLPFTTFQAALNVFRVNVSSTDSGADDPVVPDPAGGGTGAVARTFFDATFGAFGLRRLLVCNNSLALSTASDQLPELTSVLVVVNSLIYGGSGGSIGAYSLAPAATEIAIHEMGHSAFHLADEYSEADMRIHPAVEPVEPNVTINRIATTLKWASLLTPGVPLPTMLNPDCDRPDPAPSSQPAGTVGLFEGGNRFHCGAFRPEHNCKMRTLGQPLCRVCRQVIGRALQSRFPS